MLGDNALTLCLHVFGVPKLCSWAHQVGHIFRIEANGVGQDIRIPLARASLLSRRFVKFLGSGDALFLRRDRAQRRGDKHNGELPKQEFMTAIMQLPSLAKVRPKTRSAKNPNSVARLQGVQAQVHFIFVHKSSVHVVQISGVCISARARSQTTQGGS